MHFYLYRNYIKAYSRKYNSWQTSAVVSIFINERNNKFVTKYFQKYNNVVSDHKGMMPCQNLKNYYPINSSGENNYKILQPKLFIDI